MSGSPHEETDFANHFKSAERLIEESLQALQRGDREEYERLKAEAAEASLSEMTDWEKELKERDK